MGFAGMQPSSDKISIAAMLREIEGGECEFLQRPPKDEPDKKMPTLRPISFGSRTCKGNKTRLHSYLGEAFAGDWGMGKCHHYMWGT